MSCYQVEDETLHVLVGAMLYGMAHDRAGVRCIGFDRFSYWDRDADARVELTPENASEVGRMLARWNAQSVADRYREPLAVAQFEGYAFVCPHFLPTPGEVAKAAACLGYQSCEAAAWEGSPAACFLETVNARVLRTLPGYADAPWGWNREQLAERNRSVAGMQNPV